jgi:TIR domain
MAGKIFINYRRGDDPGFAQALFARLEQAFPPEQLFMDVEYIEPGLDFVRVLTDQVAECDVLISVIGKGWIDARDDAGARRLDNPADFVRIEIESARAHDKRVIPVLVGQAQMPRTDQLPETMKPFATRNAVRLTHERFRSDTRGLIAALQCALKIAEDARKEKPERLDDEAQLTTLKTGPDWPIHGLFTHVNPDLLARVDDGVGDSWDEIGNDIRDHAALGLLKIWGRPVRNGLGRMLGEREALRLIEPSYWTTAFLTYNFFDSTAGDAPHTYLEVGRSGVEYTDLRVNRAEASLIWPPTTQNALQLKLGSGDEFETRQSSGLYQTNHTFSVCVENRDATRFLSNCKLSLNIANEGGNGRKDYWLEGPFTLNPTEKRFRSVFTYLEPATISKYRWPQWLPLRCSRKAQR